MKNKKPLSLKFEVKIKSRRKQTFPFLCNPDQKFAPDLTLQPPLRLHMDESVSTLLLELLL